MGTATAAGCIRGTAAGLPPEGGRPRLGFAAKSAEASRSIDGLRLLPLAVGAAEGGRPRLAFATSVDASRSIDGLRLLTLAVGAAESMAARPAGRAAPLVALEEAAGPSACRIGSGGGACGGRWAGTGGGGGACGGRWGSCWRRADMTTCVFLNSLGGDPTRAAWFRAARPLVLGLATGLSPVRSTTK